MTLNNIMKCVFTQTCEQTGIEEEASLSYLRRSTSKYIKTLSDRSNTFILIHIHIPKHTIHNRLAEIGLLTVNSIA